MNEVENWEAGDFDRFVEEFLDQGYCERMSAEVFRLTDGEWVKLNTGNLKKIVVELRSAELTEREPDNSTKGPFRVRYNVLWKNGRRCQTWVPHDFSSLIDALEHIGATVRHSLDGGGKILDAPH